MSGKLYKVKVALFLTFASISVAANYLIFELRYKWYLSADESIFLSIGYVFFMAFIVCMWALHPSRLATVALGTLSLIFPSIISGDKPPSLEFKLLATALLGVGLLLVTTEFRQCIWKKRD